MFGPHRRGPLRGQELGSPPVDESPDGPRAGMAGRDTSGTVLRGATLVSAPFTLVGIIMASLAVFGVLWSVDRGETTSGWVFVAATGLLAVSGFAAARGCRVVITDDEVRDVVAWRAVRVVPKESVEAVRVRRGPWRTFEVETDDGVRFVLLGTGPVQFPSYLLPGAAERDLAAIDALGAELRS
jgi:hypothetical protein